MALFTDTVTIYHKIFDSEWKRTVICGVQWTDKEERQNNNGKISIVRYVSVTFPEDAYENLDINAEDEEDCMVYGVVEDEITDERGKRVSDLLRKYPKSGIIRSVRGNSNRSHLKNIKVVLS